MTARTLKIAGQPARDRAKDLEYENGYFRLNLDEDEVLDITFDWSDWLAATGDTISASTWENEGNITLTGTTNTTTTAYTKLSGGPSSVPRDYSSGYPCPVELTNQIVTANGLTKRKTIHVVGRMA